MLNVVDLLKYEYSRAVRAVQLSSCPRGPARSRAGSRRRAGATSGCVLARCVAPGAIAAGGGGMDSFRRPGGFASPLSPTRRHLSAENCTDASCGCSVDASGTAVGAWARSRQPSPRRDAGLEVETRRVQPWCGKFELRPYVQLVAVDTEARRVAVFLFSQLAVLALELLLPALWRMDPTLLGAALRGLLRSISLALVLHAMAMKTRPPTTAYSYGCAIFPGRLGG